MYNYLEYQYDTNSKYVEYGLGIDCPDLKIEAEYNVDNFIKMSEELSDFYKELEVSIEKVKIKYPDKFVYCIFNFFHILYIKNLTSPGK